MILRIVEPFLLPPSRCRALRIHPRAMRRDQCDVEQGRPSGVARRLDAVRDSGPSLWDTAGYPFTSPLSYIAALSPFDADPPAYQALS